MKITEVDVAKLELKDGDLLMFRVPQDSFEVGEYEQLVMELGSIFEEINIDIKGFVLYGDIDVSIIRKKDDKSNSEI